MPVIPQITNPFHGKGYQSSLSNNQNRPGGEQFDIIQLTKPQTVLDYPERQGGKQPQQQLIPNRTDLPQLMVKTPKDPTMAVETLKQLISSELLATAEANGYTELHGELEGLSKSIYLQVNELVSEMLNQEEQTTMFSGDKLFDLLRGLASGNELPGSDEKLVAIANFLKAVNFSFNRGEILNALSANLKFLSTYFSPSPILSEKLAALADAWSGIQARENFELLKGETVKLLHNVSESLLNNEKTQILIPLIIHNLSRYNTNDYMLKDAFSHMMTHVPHSQKGAFMAAFDDFLNTILYGNSAAKETAAAAQGANAQAQPATEAGTPAGTATPQADGNANAQGAQTAPASERGTATQGTIPNDNTQLNKNQDLSPDKMQFPRLYGEKLAEGSQFPSAGMNRDSLADGLRGFLLGRFAGLESVGITLSNLVKGMNDPTLYSALQTDLAKVDSITVLINYLNDILMQLPDVPERQILFEMLSETVSGMAEKGELPPESPQQSQPQPEQAQTQQTQQTQQAQQTQQYGQAAQTPEQAQTAQQAQAQAQPEQAQAAQNQQAQPEQVQNQSGQPQSEQSLSEQAQAQQGQVQTEQGQITPERTQILLSDVQPPSGEFPALEAHSSLEELTAFIEKNINHSALKTLDSYNASNLLQSLINAPGVYTPLSHFIIPLQIGDTRAFGELWVDNEDRSTASGGEPGEKTYHLFLTFEIEAVGRFETDLYAVGAEVNLAVMHPEGFSGEIKSLKEKINRIIASTDYSVKEFQTGVLREPHDLTQIFPRIVEKRQGLDISI